MARISAGIGCSHVPAIGAGARDRRIVFPELERPYCHALTDIDGR